MHGSDSSKLWTVISHKKIESSVEDFEFIETVRRLYSGLYKIPVENVRVIYKNADVSEFKEIKVQREDKIDIAVDAKGLELLEARYGSIINS
jgi:hypothetical protein